MKHDVTRREAARLLVLGGCGLAAPFLDPRPVAGSDIEELLEGARRRHGLPGLAAAVVNGTGGIVSGAAGVRRWRSESRLQPGDRFHEAVTNLLPDGRKLQAEVKA